MNHNRKQFLRREMLACAREAAFCAQMGWEQVEHWRAAAARRLFELGGLMGNW
jgi:hypothetical protein